MRTKTCKARISSHNKKKCGKKFTTKKKNRKHCSEQCRKRNSEILLREKQIKIKREIVKEEKVEKYSLSLMGKIKKLISEIEDIESEINYYQNLKKPKIKKSMDYSQKIDVENLIKEYDYKMEQFKMNEDFYEKEKINKIGKIVRILRVAYNDVKEKTPVQNVIISIKKEINALFPNTKIVDRFNSLAKDMLPEKEEEKKPFDPMSYFTKNRR